MENNIDSKSLAIEIAKILDQKKAHDVRVLKVESLTVLTDYFVIASGTSTTQVASLADEVEFELSQKGSSPQHRGLRLQELGAAGLLQRHRARVCAQHPHLLRSGAPVGRRRAHRHLGVSDAGSQPVREHIPARCFPDALSVSHPLTSSLAGEPLAKTEPLQGMPRPLLQGEVALRSNDGEAVSRNTGQ